MRISYKRLMEFLDDQLSPGDCMEVEAALREGSFCLMLARLKQVMDNPAFVQCVEAHSGLDDNSLAAYLDGTLPKEEFQRLEELLAQDDYLLGRLAQCHRIITSATAIQSADGARKAAYLAGKELGADPFWVPPTTEVKKNLAFNWEPIQTPGFWALLALSLAAICLGVWLAKTRTLPGEKFHKAMLALKDKQKHKGQKDEGNVPGKLVEKDEKKEAKKVEPKEVEKKVFLNEEKKVPEKRVLPPERAGGEPRKIKVAGGVLKKEGQEWQPCVDMIATGQEILVLPGCSALAKMEDTSAVAFWGREPLHSLAPCRFSLHSRGGVLIDFSLQQGTAIVHSEIKGHVLVRLGNPPQFCELELSQGARVVIESNTFDPSGINHFRIYPREGRATLWADLDATAKGTVVPGFSLVQQAGIWKLREMSDGLPSELDPLAEQTPALAAREELKLALKPGMAPVKAIEEFLHSPLANDPRRQLGFLSLASIDSLDPIWQEILGNVPSRGKHREAAWEALKMWAGKKSHFDLIYRSNGEGLLKEKFPQDAELASKLLVIGFGDTTQQVEGLLQGLRSGRAMLREECRRRLSAMSKGKVNPPPGVDSQTIEQEIMRWKEIMKGN